MEIKAMFGFRRKEEQMRVFEAYGAKWIVREDVRLMIEEIAKYLTEEELKMFEREWDGICINFNIEMFDKCIGYQPKQSIPDSRWDIERHVNRCRFLISTDPLKREIFLDFLTFALFKKSEENS